MHLLLVGGSPNYWGGVEEFCERATLALERNGDHRVDRIVANSAYLSIKRVPDFVRTLFLLRRSKEAHPDCVWIQYGNLPDLVYLLFAKLIGFKVLVTPHLGSNWRSQSNPVLRYISGWMLSFADRIALISKTQERELKLPVNVPRSYIRNFLPSSILSAEPVSRQISAIPKLQLLHAARLSEGKGTFLFVDVCAQLRELNVPFAARIVGGADGDTIGRLKQKIKDLGLSESVIVLGRVSDDDLFQHLKNSDALVHLSKIDSYPLIVLESILSCTIPVCMDLPGARDMAGTYAGHIVSEVTAVEETARFLARHSSEDLASLTRDAAARVRIDYSWDSCVSMLEAALLAVAAQRPGPASSPSEG